MQTETKRQTILSIITKIQLFHRKVESDPNEEPTFF